MQFRAVLPLLGSCVRHRPGCGRALILAAGLPALGGALPPPPDVSVTVTGLRSASGQILACMTARPESFPGCDNDPAARRRVVPATETRLDFGSVPEGRYAIAVVHDENANGRLDKRLMMPREGYGFSHDAPVMMGPPRFASAAFLVGSASEHLTIRMRYLF